MEVKVERLGKVSFTVRARNHMVVSDQPKGNGGTDLGMTPPELFPFFTDLNAAILDS